MLVVIGVLLCFCLSPVIAGAQNVQIDKGVTVNVQMGIASGTCPSSLSLAGVRIGVDVAHDASGRQSSVKQWYLTIMGDLTGRGAMITYENSYPITAALLSKYDIYWIEEDWYSSYSQAEMDALKQWVEEGGGLLFNGDESYSSLVSFFNLPYAGTGGCGGSTSNITHPHHITEGCTTINMDSPVNSINPISPAVDIVRDGCYGLKEVAVNIIKCGAVVSISDEVIIDWNINNNQTRLFANQVFDFLADPGACDGDGGCDLTPVLKALDAVETKLDALGKLPGMIIRLTTAVDALETKLDVAARERAALESKSDALEVKLDAAAKALDKLESKLDSGAAITQSDLAAGAGGVWFPGAKKMPKP